MVRKFLYVIAVLIVLVIAAMIALRLWTKELAEIAFVPREPFVVQQPLDNNAYQDPAMWFSRPGIGVSDPARWQPAMASGDGAPTVAATAAAIPPVGGEAKRNFAVFFIHPTSYMSSAHWNAPLDDQQSQDLARLYIKGMASPFNQASEIWAPRYRQAAFGSFLSDAEAAQQAKDAAYADVLQAFDYFLASVDKDEPIVLVGHSQGALHLERLLRERVAGMPLAHRVAAAYIVGWPVSVEHDLPSLGLPACATPGQPGCIMSWSSFAEPADPGTVLEAYAASKGFDGKPRGTSRILCTNPLTGSVDGTAPASSNLGTLVPDGDLSSGELVPASVPARCDSRGLLLIGDPPEMGSAVLPGNNYHVYDLPLFWKNVQADVVERVNAWQPAR
ncbi:MAG: DUF3089 domain-containing protein [Sphingomonadales bacterium]|nr:DUF3089 domain-containing protein [Sphingomonadales bacterium]MBD3773370.1 DUF3089 domain-containing protein [Paracoccaceae bacterium]